MQMVDWMRPQHALPWRATSAVQLLVLARPLGQAQAVYAMQLICQIQMPIRRSAASLAVFLLALLITRRVTAPTDRLCSDTKNTHKKTSES